MVILEKLDQKEMYCENMRKVRVSWKKCMEKRLH